MDFKKLTIKSQEAVGAAGELARRRGNPEVYPEHLLLALLDQELPRTLVERAGSSVDGLRRQAEATLASKPSICGAQQQPHVSAAFAELLDRAEDEMRALDDEYVSTEHLLLGARRRPARRAARGPEGGARLASASPRRIPRAPTRRSRSSART